MYYQQFDVAKIPNQDQELQNVNLHFDMALKAFCKEVQEYRFDSHVVKFVDQQVILKEKKRFELFKKDIADETAQKICLFLEENSQFFGQDVEMDHHLERFIILYAQEDQLSLETKARLDKISTEILLSTHRNAERIIKNMEQQQKIEVVKIEKEIEDLQQQKVNFLAEEAEAKERLDAIEKAVSAKNTYIIAADKKNIPVSLKFLTQKCPALFNLAVQMDVLDAQQDPLKYKIDLSNIPEVIICLCLETIENHDYMMNIDTFPTLAAMHNFFFELREFDLSHLILERIKLSKEVLYKDVIYVINNYNLHYENPLWIYLSSLMATNFEIFSIRDDFVNIPHSFLLAIANSANLTCSHDIRLKAALRWVKHQSQDKEEQKNLLTKMLVVNDISLLSSIKRKTCSLPLLVELDTIINFFEEKQDLAQIITTPLNCLPAVITPIDKNLYRLDWNGYIIAAANVCCSFNIQDEYFFQYAEENRTPRFGFHTITPQSKGLRIKNFSLSKEFKGLHIMSDPIICDALKHGNTMSFSNEVLKKTEEEIEELKKWWRTNSTISIEFERIL